jgi:hypothetical protein
MMRLNKWTEETHENAFAHKMGSFAMFEAGLQGALRVMPADFQIRKLSPPAANISSGWN